MSIHVSVIGVGPLGQNIPLRQANIPVQWVYWDLDEDLPTQVIENILDLAESAGYI
jgi:hypothetical protein